MPRPFTSDLARIQPAIKRCPCDPYPAYQRRPPARTPKTGLFGDVSRGAWLLPRPAGSHEAQALVPGAQRGLLVGAEPPLQHGAVDRSKVNAVLEVTVRVEISQARMIAVQAALHARSDDEHWRRGPVIRPQAGILVDPSPELRERHHEDAVGFSLVGDVPQKRVNGVRKAAKEPAVSSRLGRVRVEAPEGDVVDPRSEIAGHE